MTKTKEEIIKVIKGIIARHLEVKEEQIKDESTISDLGGDSLDGIEIIMSLEDEFGFEIPDHEAENFHTFMNLAKYLNDRYLNEAH